MRTQIRQRRMYVVVGAMALAALTGGLFAALAGSNHAAATRATPVRASITVNPDNNETFAPPADAAPAITAEQARAKWENNAGATDPRFGGGGHTGNPVTYASATQAPTAAPQSSGDAAGQVLRGLGGTNVQGLQASPSPAGLIVTVTLAENDDSVPDVWLAGLAVGALAERMRTNQAVINDEIASATAVGPGSSGAQVTSDVGPGAVALGQVFNPPSDAVLTSRVNTVAQQFGLKVARVSILHPLESALRVTFMVPDSATIDWTLDQLRTALVGASPDVEGILIELDNSAGKPLPLAGGTYRTGVGGLWFAPGQDDRFGAIHGGTPAGTRARE